ncbi:kinase-like protein [Rhizopogon salebrosus TDB-379]|nr:kinase-like protein [Rhizopogon salebrosus TDB-379]
MLVAVKSPRFPGLGDDQIAKINKACQSLDREIDIWVILKHEYVLPFHGTVEGFGPFRALVSPWMPEGNLDSYLKRACEALTAMDKLRMVTLLKQITEGLKYLHDNNVIHGDLTSNNVLIAADGSPRLADFGISNIVMLTNPAFHHHTGAVRWAAPEFMVIPEDQITIQYGTKSSDIYALGGIMLQVLYGKQPYWWLRSPIHVVAAKYQGMEPINSSIQIQPHHLEFMRRCWSAESTARPSVEDVLTFLQAEEELLEESPSVQVHFIPAHTLPTPPQPEGVHKLNDLELSHHSRNVPSDHDETGVVSSSSSARPLDVTFETIRQKDGAADRDEESEEDEFYDARTPQTENSEGNDRVRDEDQESDEDVDLLVNDISLQLSSLTPSWGPIVSVRKIGGEDIEGRSSRSATILTLVCHRAKTVQF